MGCIIRLVPTALKPITDPKGWDAFLETQNAHLLQTYAWGELKSQFGWRAERLALETDNQMKAAAQILYRPIAPALTLAYIPRGPVATTDADLARVLEQVKRHVRARGVFMLKIEPDWLRDDSRNAVLAQLGAVLSPETIQPPATIHLDLTADLDMILARMKSKWRYNIRLSEKKGVVVRAGTVSDFDAFYQLMLATGERDQFAIHGSAYYRRCFELLDARDNVRLLVAEYENQPLGMIFVTAFAHEAIYLYGASGNAERNRMPNHALHWAAIQWAKARGCTRYDLWGIPETVTDTEDDANLPSSLYQFKQGFGGTIVRYSGAHDVIFNSAIHQVYKLARRVRKNAIA